jgi:hypothetical protein
LAVQQGQAQPALAVFALLQQAPSGQHEPLGQQAASEQQAPFGQHGPFGQQLPFWAWQQALLGQHAPSGQQEGRFAAESLIVNAIAAAKVTRMLPSIFTLQKKQ